MQPVRVKYYGLFWLRRPTYLVLQTIALIGCLTMMGAGLLGMAWSGSVLPHLPPPGHDDEIITQALVLLFWVGLLALVAEGTETYVMLRKFARAEAEQQAKLAAREAGESAPLAPRSTAVQSPSEKPSNTNLQP
jgi:hypothetical protein